MADQDIVTIQGADGKLWDIPRANLAIAQQRGAKLYTPPGALKRGLTSLAGVPEDINLKDTSGITSLGAWFDALKQAASSLNPVPAATEAARTGMRLMSKPGLTNKLAGATEYALSPIPYAGPTVVRSMEQARTGDIAGSAGSGASALWQLAGLSKLGPAGGEPGSVTPRTGLAESTARWLNKPPLARIPGFESGVGIGPGAELVAREEAQSRLAKIKEENKTVVEDARTKVREANEKTLSKHQENKVALTAARNEYERTVNAVDRREALLDQAKKSVEPIAEALPNIREQARAVAKSLYPEITGTREAATIKEGIQREIDTHMRGAGRIPPVLARILDELTPKASTERAITQPEEKGSLLARNLLNQNMPPEEVRSVIVNLGYLPREVNTIMEVARGALGVQDPTIVNFDKLHGMYSELGAAWHADMPGDEKAAIQGGKNFIGRQMESLAEAENKVYRFGKAQENWGRLENTFYNTAPLNKGGSPIARALQAFDRITKKLRPEFVHDALSGESEYNIARRMLAKYPTLVHSLDAMKRATDAAEKLPKQAPSYVVDTGIKEVKPSDLEPLPTAKDLELKPEEEFDRLKWRLDTLKEKAKQLTGMTRFEANPRVSIAVPFRRTLGRILADPEMRERIASIPSAMKALADVGLIDLGMVPRPTPGEKNQ